MNERMSSVRRRLPGPVATDAALGQHDAEWSLALTGLLVEVEPLQRRLVDLRNSRSSAVPFIEGAVHLVERVVAFADQQVGKHLRNEQLSSLLQQASELSHDARRFHSMAPKSRFFNFFRQSRSADNGGDRRDASPTGLARRKLFSDIVRTMMEVVEGFFILFSSCFMTPVEAYTWTTTYEVFLAELKSMRIEGVQKHVTAGV